MAMERAAEINVIWGIEPIGDNYRYELRNGFSCRSPRAQLALAKFCDDVQNAKELKVFVAQCWPQKFRDFMVSKGRVFPSLNFESDLQLFLNANRAFRSHVGFDERRRHVTWLFFKFRVEFDTHSSGRATKPFMEAWERFTERATDKDSPLGVGVPASDIFERAEAELMIVNSALSSWLISVACALIAVIFFTRSFWLSAVATFAIFATAACSVFTIVMVFKWEFGIMEAVSLIIFCGFSVDYPLHVVQAHIQETNSKGTGAREALREIGCAVTSGCITTCGAAVFLLLCEINLFNRFSQVLMCNMVFSLIFAVIWIPSALELYDPLQKEGGCLFSFATLSQLRGAFGLNSKGETLKDEEMEELPPEGFVMLDSGQMTPRNWQ
eukprot:TRINITY_DN56753_c0_g1_i1.p1 TRINITY_DN56753_c0_g1~~TRINITY_DN56753_c0_g1_i1.p1  ORF type:complete len:418 (+),score=72.00 TRINITY_DN56753_c0_g1_i1:108-1256(+)